MVDGKRGVKLEKNCVIKMGRVRLRVRDIDYADDVKRVPTNLAATPQKPEQPNNTPKKATTSSKLKDGRAVEATVGGPDD